MSVTSPRALAGLLAWLAGGTLLAAMLGALALVPLQLVYGLGALALAAALHEAPGRGMPLLERLTGPLPALQLEGLCLGASVALVFPALGAFALTARAWRGRRPTTRCRSTAATGSRWNTRSAASCATRGF